MAEGHNCTDSGTSRNIYPALTIAAIAGLAFTTYLFMKKTRCGEDTMPVEKVVNLCNSAADRLDAFVAQLAS